MGLVLVIFNEEIWREPASRD